MASQGKRLTLTLAWIRMSNWRSYSTYNYNKTVIDPKSPQLYKNIETKYTEKKGSPIYKEQVFHILNKELPSPKDSPLVFLNLR